MTLKSGDFLPQATFKVPTADGAVDRTTQDVFAGKKVVLFGVPGAFTPTCSMNHLPGFLAHAEAFKQKGVDTIAVVAVNDAYVMGAWAKATGAGDKILFLADGSGAFTRACGLDADLSGGGLGLRCKRFSAVVDDGRIETIHIEDSPGKLEVSSAEALLREI